MKYLLPGRCFLKEKVFIVKLFDYKSLLLCKELIPVKNTVSYMVILPPFLHGAWIQSSMFTSQSFPEKPDLQMQR